MIKKILFVLCLLFLISSASALTFENYTETLLINGFYSFTGVTSGSSGGVNSLFLDNYTGTPAQAMIWYINFDYYPTNVPTTSIIQINQAFTNITDSYIEAPISVKYAGETIMTGTMSIANGSFAGNKYQIVFTMNPMTKPVGAIGLKQVLLIGNIVNSEGKHIMYKDLWCFTGILNNPLQMGSAQYIFTSNYNVYLSNIIEFAKDEFQIVHINLRRSGYNSILKIYTPLNTLAYTTTSPDTADIINLQVLSSGKMKGGISTLVGGGITVNSSSYYGNNYTSSIMPSNVTLGYSTTDTIFSGTNTLSQITAFSIRYLDSNGNPVDFHPLTNQYEDATYLKNGATWYAWNNSVGTYSISKGATMPNGIVLYPKDLGKLTVHTMIYTIDEYIERLQDIFVTSDGSTVSLLLQATDKSTGAFIPSPNYAILNKLTNVWTNVTGSAYDSHYTLSVLKGSTLQVYASASGYVTDNQQKTILGNDIITIPLASTTGLPSSVSAINQTNLQVQLKFTNDGVQYYPMSNILVHTYTFDPVEPTPIKDAMTNSEGIASFIVLNQSANHTTTYNTVVSANPTGYTVVSKSVLPTGYLYTVQLFTQSNSVITQNPTVIPTTGAIITLPITPQIVGWNGALREATVCMQPPYPTGWTITDGIYNGIACSGVRGALNQSLIMAIIIMMVCGLTLAKYGKGIGALAGVIAGAGISFGMGILPIWILVFTLLLAGLVLAGLIFKGGK